MPIHLNDTQTTRYLSELEKGFRSTGYSLSVGASDKKASPAIQRILNLFDSQQSQRLHQEATRFLSDGIVTGNLQLPAGLSRSVIKQALVDSRILEICQVLTDDKATSTTAVPYELRRPGLLASRGIVFEGQPIPRASIEQKNDLSYIQQIKLSMQVSNEAVFFSRALASDWDAWAAAVRSNAALVKELVCQRIADELQRSADAFGAVAVEGEDLAAQLDGTASLVKLASWPVVRPRQVRDLRGVAIGAQECPIVLVVDGAPVPQWDGTGLQPPGLYWKAESWNTGLIRLVDQDGDPATPNATTATVGYHYSTNVQKFDLNHNPAISDEQHMDALIRVIGAARAQMMGKRYIAPDFALMSPLLNNSIADAPTFFAANARSGTALSGSGDLLAIKQIPVWSTAQMSDLRDAYSERIIIGQRGTLTYVTSKVFSAGTPFEALGPNRLPTGERIAYGEEYSSIHIPAPIRNRLTSIVTFDSVARENAE